MSELTHIADELVQFVASRAWLTTGTREELHRLIVSKISPLAPGHQPSFDFDVCAGKHGGNPMSVKAQEMNADKRLSQRKRVYLFLHAAGANGATVEEISERLKMRYTTVSARCSEMKAEGMIKDSGRTRATSTDSPASVLVVG